MRAREESNLQPPGPQPGVLSIELRAQVVVFYRTQWLEANLVYLTGSPFKTFSPS